MTDSQKLDSFYFERWTIQELKKYAKEHKLTIPAHSTKEEILKLITQKLPEKEEKIEMTYPAIDNYINICSKNMKSQYFITTLYGTNLFLSFIFLSLLLNNIVRIKGNDFFDTDNTITFSYAIFLFILFYFMTLFRNFYVKRKINYSSLKYFKDLRNYLLKNEKIEDPSALELLRSESSYIRRYKYIQNKIFKEKLLILIIVSWMIFFTMFFYIFHFFLLVIIIVILIFFIQESKINNLITRITSYVKYCYKEFIKESNVLLNNYMINNNLNKLNDLKLILNNMVDLINYKIFGKNSDFNDNYRVFQTETNITQLLTFTYKFENAIYKKITISKETNKNLEEQFILEYIEKIRKENEYELGVFHLYSKKLRYNTVLSKYILPSLAILSFIWTLMQIINFIN